MDFARINLWATLIGALFCLGVGKLIDRSGSRIVLTVVALALAVVVRSLSNRLIGRLSDRFVFSRSAQRSPRSPIGWAILRMAKLRGVTLPRSTSSQVHGAETGAPGLARTV